MVAMARVLGHMVSALNSGRALPPPAPSPLQRPTKPPPFIITRAEDQIRDSLSTSQQSKEDSEEEKDAECTTANMNGAEGVPPAQGRGTRAAQHRCVVKTYVGCAANACKTPVDGPFLVIRQGDVRRKYGVYIKETYVDPHTVLSRRGEALGRAFVEDQAGDFFIMYSGAEAAFIGSCAGVESHLMLDAIPLLTPNGGGEDPETAKPGYCTLFVACLHSYSVGRGQPVFFALMSAWTGESCIFVLDRLKELLRANGVASPAYITYDESDLSFQAAAKAVFSSCTEYVPSFYLYACELWRKCWDLTAKRKRRAKQLLFAFFALPFVGVPRTRFDQIVERQTLSTDNYARFFEYFQSVYLDSNKAGKDSILGEKYVEMLQNAKGRERIAVASKTIKSLRQRFDDLTARGPLQPTTSTIIEAIREIEHVPIEEFQQEDEMLGYFLKATERELPESIPYYPYNDARYFPEVERDNKSAPTPYHRSEADEYLDYNAARCGGSKEDQQKVSKELEPTDHPGRDPPLRLWFEPRPEVVAGTREAYKESCALAEALYPPLLTEEIMLEEVVAERCNRM